MLFLGHNDNNTITNLYEDSLEDFSIINKKKPMTQKESSNEGRIFDQILNTRSTRYKKLISDLNKIKYCKYNNKCRQNLNCQKKLKS
tara:strand:- start:639 stop:899 length:261 start_codon:yes stop_codon:yes gene_type:complete